MHIPGFGFDGRRLDINARPFRGGVPQDVRITTRYNENDLLSALFGVIYKAGHARYEQNLSRSWVDQLTRLVHSTAIYGSQNPFFEMQLGHSKPPLNRLLPMACERSDNQPVSGSDNFTTWNQWMKLGLIRIDTDEVSYSAHVILRYEIEHALVGDEIEVDDIPTLWGEKTQHWLGLSTTGSCRGGCIQDIRWADSGFNYFSSYTLGAMYATQLMVVARRMLPTLDRDIAERDLSVLFDWLRQNIWQYGSRFSTSQLIQQTIGEDLNSRYFREHPTARYL